MLFVCYPKCSTCKKAQKWLDESGAEYTLRDIKTDNPTAEELKAWWEKSGLPLKRFFNTSGNIYKEMKLKDKLPEMSEEEQLALLATDGMLVKRQSLLGKTRCWWALKKRMGRVSEIMKKKLNYADIVKETVILTVAVANHCSGGIFFPSAKPYVGQQYFRSWNRAFQLCAAAAVGDYHDPECGIADHWIFYLWKRVWS